MSNINEHHQYKQIVFLNLRALDYTIKILMNYDNIVHCTCSAGKIPNEWSYCPSYRNNIISCYRYIKSEKHKTMLREAQNIGHVTIHICNNNNRYDDAHNLHLKININNVEMIILK